MADFPADDDIPLAGQLCSHYITQLLMTFCILYLLLPQDFQIGCGQTLQISIE